MKIISSLLFYFLVVTACHTPHKSNLDHLETSKIKFDLNQLDENGLSGTEGGKVALSYEFCIPDIPVNREKVKKIDPTIQFMKSMGRSMCTDAQILCIGHTNQPKFKRVLNRLAKLKFVEKISETYFE